MTNLHFEDFQLDVLKEVGNIGAGNAATALSKLLDKPVDMQVPQVRVLPFDEVAEVAGGTERVVVAIFMRIVGDATGNIFFLISMESAKHLLRSLAGIRAGDSDSFTEMEISALSEIGNILIGSYLSSLADFTNLNLQPTVPALSIDMAGAVLNYGLIQFGAMSDRALLIETKFLEGMDAVEGNFFVIPDPDSFPRLFAALGVPIDES